jgi:hypothetical protein
VFGSIGVNMPEACFLVPAPGLAASPNDQSSLLLKTLTTNLPAREPAGIRLNLLEWNDDHSLLDVRSAIE